MPEDIFRILFVVNKSSGRKKRVNWEAIIKKHMEGLQHSTRFFRMEENGSPLELNKAIVEYKPHKVIAVGGDGTVNFVAKELVGTPVHMGILPAGSANGMAKELGIPDDPEEALKALFTGEIKNTDTIELNNSKVCVHLSDIGLNAQLIKYFEEGNTRGKIGYALALIKTLYRKHQVKVTVQTKENEVHRSALMVLIANASKYGTGATINPEGNLFDGFFEVIIVRKIGLREILKMFLKFQRFDPKKIEMLSAKSVILETRRRAHFQVDGEYMGKVNKVIAKIIPGRLKLIVPKK